MLLLLHHHPLLVHSHHILLLHHLLLLHHSRILHHARLLHHHVWLMERRLHRHWCSMLDNVRSVHGPRLHRSRCNNTSHRVRHHRLSYNCRSHHLIVDILHLHHILLMESLHVNLMLSLRNCMLMSMEVLDGQDWSHLLLGCIVSRSSLVIVLSKRLLSSFLLGLFNLFLHEFLLILRSIFIFKLPFKHSDFSFFCS